MLRHLDYDNLPTHDEDGHKLSKQEAKKQRFEQIQSDAYDIYKAADWLQAVDALKVFFDRWYSLEPKALKTFLYDIDLTFNFYDFDPSLHLTFPVKSENDGRIRVSNSSPFPISWL